MHDSIHCFSVFDLWAITNNVAMNIHIQIFACTNVFIYLENIPRSTIACYYGKSMFNILRNCQTVFQICYTILYTRQKYMNILVSPYTRLLLLSYFKKLFLFFNTDLGSQQN